MARPGRSYPVKPHIGKFIGPYPALPGPVSRNLIHIALQPRVLRPHPHITPILGPQVIPAKASPPHLFRARLVRVPTPRPHLGHFIGPYPPLRPVSTSLLGTTSQSTVTQPPTVLRPKPHITPVLGAPVAVPPISSSFLLRAKQPPATRPKPYIIVNRILAAPPPPAPPVASPILVIAPQPTVARPRAHILPFAATTFVPPVASSKIVRAVQPTVARPRPHTTRFPLNWAPCGSSKLVIARQPTVIRPRPHTQPFTSYVAAVAPVSRSLMVRTRYKVPPTRTRYNSVSILNVPQPPATIGQRLLLMGVS